MKGILLGDLLCLSKSCCTTIALMLISLPFTAEDNINGLILSSLGNVCSKFPKHFIMASSKSQGWAEALGVELWSRTPVTDHRVKAVGVGQGWNHVQKQNPEKNTSRTQNEQKEVSCTLTVSIYWANISKLKCDFWAARHESTIQFIPLPALRVSVSARRQMTERILSWGR